jgi:rod shape-determining protein MreC
MPRAMEHQQTPAFFVRGPSPFARLVFFAAVSLALMATDSRLHYLTEVRQGFIAVLHPLQILANTPSNLYFDAKEYLVTHDTLLKDNRQLTQQALKQSVDLQRLQSLETENEHLRNLLGAARALKQPARLGEILYMGRDPFEHKLVVNLGSQQNIVAGQAVVDGTGVIGQVTRVYPFSSEITLITDKELAIPIQIERNSLRAIAFGHGRDTTIDLPYLPANVDIRKGDKLITSGIDGIYPTGLAVATVTQIERNPDSPFAKITCTPIAGIENHRQILLLGIPKTETPSGTITGSHGAATTSSSSSAGETPKHVAPPAQSHAGH